jgi:hypothetical protein
MMFAAATPLAFIKLRLFDMDKRFCYATPDFFLALPIIGMLPKTYVQPLPQLYATIVHMDRQHIQCGKEHADTMVFADGIPQLN